MSCFGVVKICISILVTFQVLMAMEYATSMTLKPRFETVSENVTEIAGNTAVLKCNVEFLGDHTVIWMNPQQVVISKLIQKVIDDTRVSIERQYTQDWNLHIRNIQYRDRGVYKCVINTEPPQIKYVNLSVLVPPEIDEDTSSRRKQEAQEGQTVKLICNATGVPPPDIQWYRDTSYDMEEKEAIVSAEPGETLIIHNISRYCEGVYECVAYNNVKHAVSRVMEVMVVFPPEVRLTTKRLGQYVGKETVLECSVSASPRTICAWEKDGKELRTTTGKFRLTVYEDGPHTITLSLLLQAVTPEDFGEYRCFASNHYGQDSETMVLYESKDVVHATPSVPSTVRNEDAVFEVLPPVQYSTPTATKFRFNENSKQDGIGMNQRSQAIQTNSGVWTFVLLSVLSVLLH